MTGFSAMARKLINQWFSQNHPAFSGKPKGMQEVLVERGLWRDKLHTQCKGSCTSSSCCGKQILELQPDFMAQR